MSLSYALLIALAEQPATGYDLSLRFRERLANVWPASHQQIYRELGKLLDQGWLTVEMVSQTERPDKKCYSITEAGLAALRDWLHQTQPRPTIRDPLLVKLFAGDLLDKTQLTAELQQLRRAIEDELTRYQAIEQAYFSEPEKISQHFQYQHLALRYGLLAAKAKLQWLEEADVHLANMD